MSKILTESEFLKSSPLRFRVKEEYNNSLERDPATTRFWSVLVPDRRQTRDSLDSHELPTDGGERVRVDVVAEEETALAEELL